MTVPPPPSDPRDSLYLLPAGTVILVPMVVVEAFTDPHPADLPFYAPDLPRAIRVRTIGTYPADLTLDDTDLDGATIAAPMGGPRD